MVYIFLAPGFEETEAVVPVDLLRRAKIDIQTVGVSGKTVTGSHKINIDADILISEADFKKMDMIILPGGLAGVKNLKASTQVAEAVRYAAAHDKWIAAICAAPTILAAMHVTDGRDVTCYPGFEADMGTAQVLSDVPCIRNGKVITGTSAGCAVPFALMLIAALKGQETADAIAKQIVIR